MEEASSLCSPSGLASLIRLALPCPAWMLECRARRGVKRTIESGYRERWLEDEAYGVPR